MKTGKLIKELRIKKGMTQEELADKTELSARTIQRIENGEVDPRAYTLQMIAQALEVDFSLFTQLRNKLDNLESAFDETKLSAKMINKVGVLIVKMKDYFRFDHFFSKFFQTPTPKQSHFNKNKLLAR